jgi:hypothetical protein
LKKNILHTSNSDKQIKFIIIIIIKIFTFFLH